MRSHPNLLSPSQFDSIQMQHSIHTYDDGKEHSKGEANKMKNGRRSIETAKNEVANKTVSSLD